MIKQGFPQGYNLGMMQVILKDEPGFKFPMMIVGANSHIHQHIKHSIAKYYDVHLFFSPNDTTEYYVSALVMSRTLDTEPYIITSYEKSSSHAILKLFENVNSTFFVKGNVVNPLDALSPIDKRKGLWINNSMYRCAKISLKDVLHLETYKEVA